MPTLYILVALVVASEAAWGERIATVPAYKVGDYWEFRYTTTSLAARVKEGKWSREIIGLLADGTIRTVKRDRGLQDYDPAMNGGAYVFVRYPLKVGDEWSFSFERAPHPYTMGTLGNGKARAVSYESVTVPAGTFDCFRVEVAVTYAVKSYSETHHWKRWYCPSVKWFAKKRWERYIYDPYTGGGTTAVDESELVMFKSGE